MDEDGDDEILKKPPPFLRDELYAGKACEADLASNPVFAKSSETGAASSRLYVKNLHKKTTENDLWLVFGSFHRVYRRSQKELPDQFSIQLLTGGRMRGKLHAYFNSVSRLSMRVENKFQANLEVKLELFSRSCCKTELEIPMNFIAN